MEDLKREIIEYLEENLVKKSAEDLVLTTIAEKVNDDTDRVKTALEELESEKAISRHGIDLEVFLPNWNKQELVFLHC